MGLDGALFAATTRFRVLDPIGQGARGVVYRAYDRELGTEVALKTLGERAAGSLTEIKREFRSLLGISHRNLVQLYELFAAEGTAFFSMELVSGRDIVSESIRCTTLSGNFSSISVCSFSVPSPW